MLRLKSAISNAATLSLVLKKVFRSVGMVYGVILVIGGIMFM